MTNASTVWMRNQLPAPVSPGADVLALAREPQADDTVHGQRNVMTQRVVDGTPSRGVRCRVGAGAVLVHH